MKISTYRKVLIAVQVLMLVALFNEDKWLPLIFPSDVPVIIRTTDGSFWCAVLSVPVVLLVFERFFLYNGYKKMTKLGNAFFTGVLVFVIGLPLVFIPARTEITGKTVTKHNILGNVSKVYEFSDASKVEAEASAYTSRGSAITRLDFTYRVTFEDEYTVIFDDIDLDENWAVVKEIDDTVRSNGIEKEVYGEGLLDSIYNYGGVGYVGPKVRELME